MSIIELDHVWEKYRIKFVSRGRVDWEEVWALKDISLKVGRGEVLGVIGHNGAGKSTLLKLVSGMLMADKGEVKVSGKVSVLMELGAGFNPEFTGRENIRLNASMYGLEGQILERQIEKVIDFADLGKFIDAPIKYYSQGMYTRLAFALAIFVEPDILLIDDILAVGDEEARRKCVQKVFELKNAGKTIILASHDMELVHKLCDRAILLEAGQILKEGLPEEVTSAYFETIGKKSGIAVLQKDKLRAVFNNGRVSLSYDGLPLTRGFGANVPFFVPRIDAWSSSSNLDWQVKSFSSDRIDAEGRDLEGKIIQVWTMGLSDTGLEWQVEIRDKNCLRPHIDLFFNRLYAHWETVTGRQDFLPFSYKDKWQQLDDGNIRGDCIGLTSTENDSGLAGVLLTKKTDESCFRVFNTGYEEESRVIQLHFGRTDSANLSFRFFEDKEALTLLFEEARNNFLSATKNKRREKLIECAIDLGDTRLLADTEEKAVKLYFRDLELTRHSGLHTSICVDDAWYDHSSAERKFRKEGDALLLEFFWPDFGLSQEWRLYFREGLLCWDVAYSNSRPQKIQALKFGLLLNPKYRRFFCGWQQESFPPYSENWRDIALFVPGAPLFGLRKEDALPAIAIENASGDDCVIQNSDRLSGCRVLQLSLPESKIREEKFSFNMKIGFPEEETMLCRYLDEEKRKIDLEKYSIISGDTRVFADPEQKAVRIYYKDNEVTRPSGGLHTIFPLRDANWQLERRSEKEIVLNLYYEAPSWLSQVLTLTLTQEDHLAVKCEINNKEPLRLDNRAFRLELKDRYQYWSTADERGDFSLNQYVQEISPVRLKKNKVPQVILESKKEDKNNIGRLLFAADTDPHRWSLGMFKGKDGQEEYICLNLSRNSTKSEALISPGSHTYFQGRIMLGESVEAGRSVSAADTSVLERKSLRLCFAEGTGRIFWKGAELTESLGLYSSVRSAGIWLDSAQAVWSQEKRGENRITCRGEWPCVPIAQAWQIELIDETTLSWEIVLEVYEEALLEIKQANLMLSNKYKKWAVTGLNQGEFCDEYTRDYDILPFRFWYGPGDTLEAGADSLPRIIFRNTSGEKALKAVVENTDYLYEARLLQYQKADNLKMRPGRYPYFKGLIKVEPKS